MKKSLLFIPFLFVLLACNFSAHQSSQVTPTIIPPQPTFTLIPEPTIVVPSKGTITGTLSYPSSFLPDMRVVAFSLTDGKAYFVNIDQPEYSIDVPAGTYYIVAYVHEGVAGETGEVDSYTLDGGTESAGGYTEMVLCGLYVDCAPHTLVPVIVEAGRTVEEVDPGDWYAPHGTFPPMPNP